MPRAVSERIVPRTSRSIRSGGSDGYAARSGAITSAAVPGEHASSTVSAVALRRVIAPVAGIRTCWPLTRTAPLR